MDHGAGMGIIPGSCPDGTPQHTIHTGCWLLRLRRLQAGVSVGCSAASGCCPSETGACPGTLGSLPRCPACLQQPVAWSCILRTGNTGLPGQLFMETEFGLLSVLAAHSQSTCCTQDKLSMQNCSSATCSWWIIPHRSERYN